MNFHQYSIQKFSIFYVNDNKGEIQKNKIQQEKKTYEELKKPFSKNNITYYYHNWSNSHNEN